MNQLPIPNITPSSVSDEEIAVYRALKPYLARCLRLNHDVNNALAAVIGYADFLLEEGKDLSDTHRRFLQQIMQAAEKIQQLVEDLCDEKIAAAQSIDLNALTTVFENLEKESD